LYIGQVQGVVVMHILVTGGTGFIGSVLVDRLLARGHVVTVLTRATPPDRPGLTFIQSLDSLGNDTVLDAVVNLAGASLAGRRWSRAYKEEIVASRLDTTAALLGLIGRLESRPAVLVSASAVGYYGHHGDQELAEDGPVTPGFAQDLCARWERMAEGASQYGVRVCLARFGVVLDSGGGAMEQMAGSLRFGVASWLGNGRQWLSWVHRDDAVDALLMMLDRPDLSGPFNVTAPGAVTSRGFCEAMKRRRGRVVTMPVPAAALRLMLGEMADEILLRGQRVEPARLLAAGFEFRYPDVDSALRDIL
jgi:uncharacterized protein (TIGR01777 family)